MIATTPDPRPVPPADCNDATRVVCDYLTQTRVTYIRALTLVRRDYRIPGQWSKHSPDDPVGALREYGAILVDSPHTYHDERQRARQAARAALVALALAEVDWERIALWLLDYPYPYNLLTLSPRPRRMQMQQAEREEKIRQDAEDCATARRLILARRTDEEAR